MDDLFPSIPQDLKTVETDEELAALRDTLASKIREVAAGRRDPEIVGDRTEAQVADEMAAAVTSLEEIKAELTTRIDDAAAYDKTITELAAKAGPEATLSAETDKDGDESDDDDGGDDSPDATAAAEPETAAAAPVATLSARPIPAARGQRKPTAQEFDTRGLRLTSHASGLGAPYDAMTVLGRKEVGEVLSEMVNKRVRPGERAVVAAATYDYPPERKLDQREGERNTEKIQAELTRIREHHFTPKALIASGGLCAPLTPIYELPGVETAVRPVRDALPSFQARRGGVIVGATPVMGDFSGAVGVVTAEENADGGTFAVKHCLRIDCPEFASVEVDSIYSCYEMDNLNGRAYPELMARVDELLRAEQARLADSRILTALAAGSIVLTGGSAGIGAVVSFLGDLYAATAQYRSSNRMPSEAPLQLIMPDWIDDLIALDIASGQFDRFMSRDQIIAAIRQAGVIPVFSLDGSSTASDGQVFDHATDGSLDGFPATVEWFLFAPGTWLHLDSGQLDLGVVRDSTLNSTNDFQVFYETWENVVKVGGDSYAVTTTVCPSGVVAAPGNSQLSCAGG